MRAYGAYKEREQFAHRSRHSVLQGFEADFVGKAHGQVLDVKIFVGHTPGRFPVVLSVYTMQGRMGQLSEVLRRAWGNLKYLGA